MYDMVYVVCVVCWYHVCGMVWCVWCVWCGMMYMSLGSSPLFICKFCLLS